MHTIDLLKGQGIPPKTTLGSVFFNAVVLVLPLLAGALLVGMYALNKTNIDMGARRIESLQGQLEKFQPDKNKTADITKEQNMYLTKLREASKCIDTYYQWTPVLITLVTDMPEDMIMDNIVVSNSSQASLKTSTDPNKPLVIPIPKKQMTVELRGIGKETFNVQVEKYKEKLSSEDSLKPILSDLKYVKQAVTPTKQDETYVMNFVFDKKK